MTHDIVSGCRLRFVTMPSRRDNPLSRRQRVRFTTTFPSCLQVTTTLLSDVTSTRLAVDSSDIQRIAACCTPSERKYTPISERKFDLHAYTTTCLTLRDTQFVHRHARCIQIDAGWVHLGNNIPHIVLLMGHGCKG